VGPLRTPHADIACEGRKISRDAHLCCLRTERLGCSSPPPCLSPLPPPPPLPLLITRDDDSGGDSLLRMLAPDSDLSPGFDPVEEWLVDFDPTMSSKLEAKSLSPSKRTRFHRHTRFSRRSPTPLLRTFTVPMKKYSNEVWYGSLLASPTFVPF
jgi:hypothetical protein